jgi:hypothetical protein
MRKADSLRRWLTAFLPDLRKEADRLQVYLEGGRISARRSATLSFAYAYTVKALITDFAGNPDTVMVATLVDREGAAPAAPDRGQHALPVRGRTARQRHL